MDPVDEWELGGTTRTVLGRSIFVREERGDSLGETIVVLHGFPSSSFDWRHVVRAFHGLHRVVLLDMLGYGLSEKPFDHHYSLFEQADIICAVLEQMDISTCALVTHDVGDSVGGELCARAVDGTLPFQIRARVVTNGSIYMDLVQLSPGQQLLLALPDEPIAEENAPNEELFNASLAATFAPDTQPSAEELASQWKLVARAGGNRILPKLIRYIGERRVHEARWTGAIEAHPSPLTVVWGDADPIAVFPMAERLVRARPDATLERLEAIGHYPMIESPHAVAEAIATAVST